MSLPVEHLSASSLTTFLRCPRQWQNKYVLKQVEPSSSALVLGSAVHLSMSRALMGEDPGSYWLETLKEAEKQGEIDWSRMKPDTTAEWAVKLSYDYYELVGKYLEVEDTEVEVTLEIPGMDIPVIGFVDVVTADRIIDLKTTGYFNTKSVRVNREWVFQMNVYQLYQNKPAELHILTRSKTDPVVVPSTVRSPLYVPPINQEEMQRFILQTYQQMEWMYETWGEDTPWPGAPTHEWSGKYCKAPNCCQH